MHHDHKVEAQVAADGSAHSGGVEQEADDVAAQVRDQAWTAQAELYSLPSSATAQVPRAIIAGHPYTPYNAA